MKRKTRRDRKAKAAPVAEPLLSPWKQIAAAAAFGAGGGGCAYWGIHDLGVFARSLSDRASIVETQSAMPGLPLMGIGLFAIGVLFLVPAASTIRFRLVQERAAIVILISLVVGAVLSVVGGPIIYAVMDAYGYRTCEVTRGRRMTFITWAASDTACPPERAER